MGIASSIKTLSRFHSVMLISSCRSCVLQQPLSSSSATLQQYCSAKHTDDTRSRASKGKVGWHRSRIRVGCRHDIAARVGRSSHAGSFCDFDGIHSADARDRASCAIGRSDSSSRSGSSRSRASRPGSPWGRRSPGVVCPA